MINQGQSNHYDNKTLLKSNKTEVTLMCILIFEVRTYLGFREINYFGNPCMSSSYSSTGFYNPLAGFSFLILEVSRSHTVTHHSR